MRIVNGIARGIRTHEMKSDYGNGLVLTVDQNDLAHGCRYEIVMSPSMELKLKMGEFMDANYVGIVLRRMKLPGSLTDALGFAFGTASSGLHLPGSGSPFHPSWEELPALRAFLKDALDGSRFAVDMIEMLRITSKDPEPLPEMWGVADLNLPPNQTVTVYPYPNGSYRNLGTDVVSASVVDPDLFVDLCHPKVRRSGRALNYVRERCS